MKLVFNWWKPPSFLYCGRNSEWMVALWLLDILGVSPFKSSPAVQRFLLVLCHLLPWVFAFHPLFYFTCLETSDVVNSAQPRLYCASAFILLAKKCLNPAAQLCYRSATTALVVSSRDWMIRPEPRVRVEFHHRASDGAEVKPGRLSALNGATQVFVGVQERANMCRRPSWHGVTTAHILCCKPWHWDFWAYTLIHPNLPRFLREQASLPVGGSVSMPPAEQRTFLILSCSFLRYMSRCSIDCRCFKHLFTARISHIVPQRSFYVL